MSLAGTVSLAFFFSIIACVLQVDVQSLQRTFLLSINNLYVIMASIPAEVEVRLKKMAASISSAGEPDQKKNQRKNRKKIRLKLYLKRSLNKPGPD